MIADTFNLSDHRSVDFHLLAYPARPAKNRYPLILILHGSGVNSESYLQNWREEAIKHHCMVLAPAISSEDTPRPEDWESLMDHIVQNYPVDSGRIYLAGASRGAFWGRALLGLRPELWKGAIFIAGPGDLEWWQAVNPKEYPPILFVHGEQDSLTAIHRFRELTAFLRDKKISVTLISYPDAGHTHNPEWNAAIFDWMEKTEKDSGASGKG